MASRPSPLMKRIWITSAILFALPFLAGLLVIVAVNPNDYRPQIEQVVFQATGRKLAIDGDISIGFGFAPVIQIHNLRLSNPPGFSRAEFATIGMIETDINLFSLLSGRKDVGHLDLFDVDVQAEINQLGQVNTNFTATAGQTVPGPAPKASDANTPVAQAKTHAASLLQQINLHEFGIFGGRFAKRDDAANSLHVLETKALVIKLNGPDQPVKVTADLLLDTKPLAFNGETGPVEPLLGLSQVAASWPVSLEARTTSASLKLTGVIADPVAMRGYRLSLDSTVDDLSELGKLAGYDLPPVRALQTSFDVTERNGLPEFSALLVRSANSDLRSFAPSLVVDRVLLSAPAMDQPMHGEVQGTYGDKVLQADLNLGTPTSLLQAVTAAAGGTATGADQRFPFELVAEALGGTMRLKGGLRHPTHLAGLDATLEAHIGDVSTLSQFTGRAMPRLSNLTISLRATDHPDGLMSGVMLDQIVTTAAPGDLGGMLDVSLRPRLAIAGKLGGSRLDLDAIQTAFAALNTSSATPSVPVVANGVAALFNPRMFSDQPIDLSWLNAQDIDLTFLVSELRAGGVPFRDLGGHLLVHGGRLTLAPVQAELPNGKFALNLAIDSVSLPPSMALALQAPGIPLKPVLIALHQPNDVTGTADVALDVHATGRTQRALAASLTGPMGLVMNGAEIDNRLLAAPLNAVIRGARLPPSAVIGNAAAGRTAVKCLATRADADRGAVSLANMVLQTPTADVQAQGNINMAEEAFSLRMRPSMRAGSTSIVVPLRVTGTFVQPVISLDPSALLEGPGPNPAPPVANPAAAARNLLTSLANAASAGKGAGTEDPCVVAQAQAHAVQPVFQ